MNSLEIRFENEMQLDEIDSLKKLLDDFFETDFGMRMDGTYVFLTDQ